MPNYRCFRCGRALSAVDSVNAGVGPVCAAKRSAELDADRKLSQENATCHHGFHCFTPGHGLTTLGRFVQRFMALAEQTGLPNEIVREAMALSKCYVDALGLKRSPIAVPDIEVPPFGDAQAIRDLRLPVELTPHGPAVKMPVDYEDQYRRLKLRDCAVCPFGLDCREPGKAVAAVWNLLSLMRYQVEPWLKRQRNAGGWGWEWDVQTYQHLANSLEVLGHDDDSRDIQAIVQAQHAARFAKASRRRAARQSAALW